ncbi:MAG TPA: tyrosine--tRNA ligase [Deltaproteobacteria bacterium]|nr:tyrosine--tRNA ligase [Deltaproteobacteria bacterium]
MPNVFDVLEERGFVEQVTDPEGLREVLSKERITCYIGFDPTAKSFHVGNLLPIMALVHMQRAGHRPIALVGGGTGLIGDPSGKKEMRRIMSREEIEENAEALKAQLSRFLDFDEGQALLLNNADWLTKLNYIEFLRDIGRHFSVNRMLQAETYRMRYETTGLNFVEFNYMLLQAYDFLYLWQHYDCVLQMGGSDQWGNICAGIDLIRRVEGGTAYGLVFPLLTTATGEKMGKTERGAVWLDPELTSPYEFYQYWINVDDRDVERFLALFTFLPMEEVRRLGSLEGEALREAKEVLAFEVTKMVHGEQQALKARDTSRRAFRGEGGDLEALPTTAIDRSRLEEGIPAYELFALTGLTSTRSEARRLIAQGGGYLNGERIESFDQLVSLKDLKDGAIILRAGKKKYHRVVAR